MAATRAAADDWPQWLGPERNAITTETVAHWPPKTLWKASVGVGYTSPVVARGRAYFVGHESRPDEKKGTDVVSCLDAASGAILWRHPYDCLTEKRDRTAGYPGPRATPAIVRDGLERYSGIVGEVPRPRGRHVDGRLPVVLVADPVDADLGEGRSSLGQVKVPGLGRRRGAPVALTRQDCQHAENTQSTSQ